MCRSMMVSVLLGLLGCFSLSAGAVHVSADNFGQVVIFPYAVAGESLGRHTLIELRNADPERHLVVSFQVKHLSGRPLFSANVVIGPNGSYATALVGGNAGVSVVRAPEGLCSTPDLSLGGNLLSYQFIAPPVSLESQQRFSVEAYALGYIAPDLATDCAAFRARYQPGGAWAPRNSTEFRNADVSPPDNSLTGWSTIIDSEQVTALNLRPLVLADFTETAMNSAPVVATRPSLLDVNPTISVRLLDKSAGGSPALSSGELMSSWAEPIHAIDALFMSTEIESNLSVAGALSASSQVIEYYPTRAYRRDPGFWGAAIERAPFNDVSDEVSGLAYDRRGEPLGVFPGSGDCDRNDASQLEITAYPFISLTGPCGEGEALLLIDGDTGTLVLAQPGDEIVSQEGHRYAGLPVVGHTLTTLRTRFANGERLPRDLSYSWARAMPAKTAIVVE